jgi:hypothetical protein
MRLLVVAVLTGALISVFTSPDSLATLMTLFASPAETTWT